jgi:hypothetical protein
VGGVGFALRAIGLDVGADLVHIFFKDEVHAAPVDRARITRTTAKPNYLSCQGMIVSVVFRDTPGTLHAS